MYLGKLGMHAIVQSFSCWAEKKKKKKKNWINKNQSYSTNMPSKHLKQSHQAHRS